MTPANIDFGQEVLNHFRVTGDVHPQVFDMESGRVREVIDSLPGTEKELIQKLVRYT